MRGHGAAPLADSQFADFSHSFSGGLQIKTEESETVYNVVAATVLQPAWIILDMFHDSPTAVASPAKVPTTPHRHAAPRWAAANHPMMQGSEGESVPLTGSPMHSISQKPVRWSSNGTRFVLT